MNTRHPSKSRRGRAAFFLRIGQVKQATERRCQYTMPLFSLALILDADGTLNDGARRELLTGRAA